MINTIVFDLGAVLIDWNPVYLYEKLFADEKEMQDFLDTICTPDWNEEQDAGRSLKFATDTLVQEYPEHESNIRAFYDRWEEMLGGEIRGTVEIFRQLKATEKYKIYALTNWSAETFPLALNRFEFLHWFDGIVVSGTEMNRKPYPEFYQILTDRYQVKPEELLFIDDNLRNIEAARQIGWESIHFISPEQLNTILNQKGLLNGF
ncbi:HAD family hydrolase [Daejeonella oryzae]|uniref:HAD family hydrolase n=1 Tax=Daejeonella oryzae TaxID=1122943 RepID=UPI0004269FA7|nr:HAD family phosphatase [Daejeonella oryzae]